MQRQRANYYNIRGEQIDPRNKAALADGMYIARYGGQNSRVYLVGGEWQNLPRAQDGIDFEGLDFSVDSDGDGVPDNAVMQNGVAYWPGGSAVLNQNNEYEIVNTEEESEDGDGGGGNKDASTGLTFDQAFRQARDAGLKTFTWNGKEYTTRTESESEEDFEKKFQENENDETTNDTTTDDDKKDDEKNIVDDSITEDENIQLNQANQKFIKDWAPESGDPLSAIGDTSILDLVKAIDTTVKDFKSENYYDPGSKEDYQKYSIKNTTDQDMYINPEALAKGKRAGNVLMDEEQKTEYYMQKFLDDRAERNPDKYGVVEDYDDDLYKRTGYLNFKDGPKQGDLIEQSGVMGDDATHIGWSLDKMNKYNTAENYLTPSDTEGMSDVNTFPTPYVLPNTGPDATQTDETVNTLSDGQVDANNNGMPDYLEVESERYGGPVYYMGGPFHGYIPYYINGAELPQAGWGDSFLDFTQGALSVAGMIPGVGILADGANTAISGGRAAYNTYMGDDEAAKKHLGNMALNATAMIPGVGQVATASKGVKGISNIAKNVGTDAVATSAKYLKSPSKIANKYVNAVTDIGKVGESVADTVQATGQTASLYKKGDFVADEVQGEGKFNKSKQYGDFADAEETPIDGGTLPEVNITADSGTTPKIDSDNINMSSMAIGSDERRAAYDAKGWAYDDTISASPTGGSEQMASAPSDSSEEMSTTTSVEEEYTPQSAQVEEPVEEIEEDVVQYGGSFYGYIPPLPQAQFGYMGSSRGKSNLNQSLKVAGTTALGSMLIRTIPQVVTQYNRKDDAWEMYNDNMDAMWARPGQGYSSWVDYCENNTCPNVPNFTPSKSDWFSGEGYTGQGSMGSSDYYMTQVGGKTKKQHREDLWSGIKQGAKDGLKTGLVNYGLNALLDNTRFGRKLQKNFDINLGWYNRQHGGESLPKAQGGTGTGITFTPGGYNSLTNQIDPLSFEDGSSEMYDGLNIDGQGTPQDNPSQLDMNASIYASKQAMNRSMDEFNAFTADMNKRMENPSLSMFQVDTNPLNVPQADFSMPDDLQRSMDEIDYKVASADNRVTSDGNVIMSADQMNQSIEETNANMQEIVDNAPKYEGTQENLDRYNEATELGFEDDFSDPDDPKFKMAEYADYEKEQEEEEIKRDLTKDKLNKDNKENNPSFLDKAWNAKNRLLDSKAGQTFGKIGAGAVRIAKPLNRLLEMREEAKRKKQMQTAYLADNMFATTDMVSGSKGDYDVNSGIFRADDKVVSRQGKYGTEISRYLYEPNVQMKKGGSFFNEGDTAEIDVNMYKELIAAGADLEII